MVIMQGLQLDYATIFVSVAAVVIAAASVRLYSALVAKPRRLRAAMAKQGIGGPQPSFLLGNIMEIKKARARDHAADLAIPLGESPTEHDCAKLLFPFFENWRQQYGNRYN